MTNSTMTLATIRAAMVFAASAGNGSNLENLIIQHLDTVRELESIDDAASSLIVLVAQGYNLRECGEILGLSERTMSRRMLNMRQSFFTDIIIPKMSMEAAHA